MLEDFQLSSAHCETMLTVIFQGTQLNKLDIKFNVENVDPDLLVSAKKMVDIMV